MPTEIRYANNIQRHDNHVPPASLTQRKFAQPVNTLILSNTGSSASMAISFDGTNVMTIKAGGVFAMDFSQIYSYWTSGNGTDTAEVILGSER